MYRRWTELAKEQALLQKLVGPLQEASWVKRYLMLLSFVVGLVCASFWMQNAQLLAQQDLGPQLERKQIAIQKTVGQKLGDLKKADQADKSANRQPVGLAVEPSQLASENSGDRVQRPDSIDQPPRPLPIADGVKAQSTSLPVPSLPKNEALEQQQAIQDIMQLRQRFGSVVTDGDGAFAEVVQHLVEEKPALKTAPAQTDSSSGLRPVETPQTSAFPADKNLLPHLMPHPPTGHSPHPSNAFAGSHNPPAIYPGNFSSGINNDRVRQIRRIARQLDQSASDLEDVGEYEAADQIRSKAQALRESCR